MGVESHDVVPRSVYGVFNGEVLVYVGSTHLPIDKLEYNHRNWKVKGYSETKFRKALTDNEKYSNVEFRVLLHYDNCNARQIEHMEGQLIRGFKPELNVDMDPVASSIKNGRY